MAWGPGPSRRRGNRCEDGELRACGPRVLRPIAKDFERAWGIFSSTGSRIRPERPRHDGVLPSGSWDAAVAAVADAMTAPAEPAEACPASGTCGARSAARPVPRYPVTISMRWRSIRR